MKVRLKTFDELKHLYDHDFHTPNCFKFGVDGRQYYDRNALGKVFECVKSSRWQREVYEVISPGEYRNYVLELEHCEVLFEYIEEKIPTNLFKL